MKLSIIIPAYNVEKYIVKCIRSCFYLECESLEIIIVNDGSTDNTLKVLNDNFSDLENIHIYTTKNNGLSAARNFGIEKATGEYIVFLDGDDWLRSDINYFFREHYLDKNLDVLFYSFQVIDENDDNRLYPIDKPPCNYDRVYTGEEIFELSMKNYACSGFYHFAWLGFYKRKFLNNNNIRFFSHMLYEDYDFWFKVMNFAKNLQYSDRICYAYRQRSSSITSTPTSWNTIQSFFKMVESILNKDNLSQPYLACAAAKLELCVIYIELRIDPEKGSFDEFKEEILNQKLSLLTLIHEKFQENSLDQLKIKYRFLSHFIFCFGIYNSELLSCLWSIRDKLVKPILDEMDEWGLSNPNKKIGLYGWGRKADVVLSSYVELVGEIKAKCSYIDSYIKSYSVKHYNRDVINVKDIDKIRFDEFIVCLNYCENELRNAIYKNTKFSRVFSPYQKSSYSLLWVFCNNYSETYLKFQKCSNQKRIILLETPEYPNVGDHLIAYAETEFLKHLKPDYQIIEITNEEYAFYKCRLNKIIKDDDILVITGGGFFGGIWSQFLYDEALNIIKNYPNNQVWVMPQSVYFYENDQGKNYKEKTKRYFNRKNLKVLCREKFSIAALNNLNIPKENYSFSPDIAFYYKYKGNIKRKNCIGIFLRIDKECILENKEREILNRAMVYSGLELAHSSMQYHSRIYKEERSLVIEEKLNEIASYRLVITDQLHCMISCVLTKTPCIAFNNISKKLEGVYEYLSRLDYLIFLSDCKNIYESIDKLLSIDTNSLNTPDFSKNWLNLSNYLNQK